MASDLVASDLVASGRVDCYVAGSVKRRLIILRHAKSAWDTDAATDHDRPLNKRGRRDAPRIAAKLVELDWTPQWVISSDSMRTRQTWQRMEDSFDDVEQVVFTRAFYHAGLGSVRTAVEDLADAVETVMVIGHNTGWEDAVAELVGEDERLTTCNAALLSVEASRWEDAFAAGRWELEHLLRPKEL